MASDDREQASGFVFRKGTLRGTPPLVVGCTEIIDVRFVRVGSWTRRAVRPPDRCALDVRVLR